MLARPARASPGSVTWRSGNDGRTPLGRPVVPEEYSMVEPLGWSANGVADAAWLVPLSRPYPTPGPPKASLSLTPLVRPVIAAAVAASSADTTSAVAPLSLT